MIGVCQGVPALHGARQGGLDFLFACELRGNSNSNFRGSWSVRIDRVEYAAARMTGRDFHGDSSIRGGGKVVGQVYTAILDDPTSTGHQFGNGLALSLPGPPAMER
ncbi:hypothetical protein [Paeniglutamicibacter cryotolerans]|uniref:Uncharacterized protein n=1 Tax=Paeniglutamicibacter cryotolerans TaxID=670079 RepID=A0A839QN84_9MICC|nr:hypothetical protein [Paeniglutamicibacter cryotolerans]MBB2997230.1 hypothetical protein [Paeniglutamicibacter cryotolerans]